MSRQASLLTIGQSDLASRLSYTGRAVFAFGLWPFYLLAAAFAALEAMLQAALLLGILPSAQGPAAMAPLFWHAYEMVLDFATTAMMGSLFTASKDQTGLQTP